MEDSPSPSPSLSSLSTPSSSSSSSSLSSSEVKICEICLSSLPLSSFSSTCEVHSFCHDCLSNFFNHEIREGKISPLPCPSFNCKEKVEDNLVFELAGDEEWDRFLNLSFQRALEEMDDVFFCPNPQCSAPIWGSSRKKEGRCFSCKGYYCMKCKDTAHFGACSLEKMLSDETRGWIQLNTRQCPRCLIYIEKNGGCDHMKCDRCHLDFYWSKTSNFMLSPRANFRNVIRQKFSGGTFYSGQPVLTPPPRQKKLCCDKDSSKKCPSCNFLVAKTASSNLLSCSNCRAKFCFACSSFIKKGSNHFGPNGRCQQRAALVLDFDDVVTLGGL